MTLQHLLPRELPAGLEDLTERAFDLSWITGDRSADLWYAVDAEQGETTRNPVLIMESASHTRLQVLARDTDFMQRLNADVQVRKVYRQAGTGLDDTWRPAEDNSVRLVPDHPLLRWPLELALIHWGACVPDRNRNL